MSSLALAIVAQLREVLGNQTASIPLHEPRFGSKESRCVQECIESTFVSSVGQTVDRFEASLAEYTGSRYAVAVVNGTCALQVALQLAGVHRDDVVLVPRCEHHCCAPYGFEMYFLNIMAGPLLKWRFIPPPEVKWIMGENS